MALVQYHHCERILQDQVGVEPSDETRNLYQQMLHHRYTVPAELYISKRSPVNPDSATAIELAIHEIHHLRQVIEDTKAELVRVEELLEQSKNLSEK
jgi:hypothetical protein